MRRAEHIRFRSQSRRFGVSILLAVGLVLSPGANAEPGGEKAADALLGLAAAMATASAGGAAAISSDSEQKNESLKAQMQPRLAIINQAASNNQANKLRSIAIGQAAASKDIAGINQAGASQRQEMQLVDLSAARAQTNDANNKARAFKETLAVEALAVAKQKSEAALKAMEPPTRLPLASIAPNANAAMVPTTAPAIQPTARGATKGAQRLLASISGEKWSGRQLMKVAPSSAPAAPTVKRAAVIPEERFVVKALQMTLQQNREARGSTRGVRVSQSKADEQRGSDLSRFVNSSTTTPSDSFTDYLRRTEGRPHVQPTVAPTTSIAPPPVAENRGHGSAGAAYNAPSDLGDMSLSSNRRRSSNF